jgi:hypothetical protein
MRAVIVAFVGGLALLATPAQATPPAPKPLDPVIYLPNQEWAPLSNDPSGLAPAGAMPTVELVAHAAGGGGTAATGATSEATGTGGTASRIGGDGDRHRDPRRHDDLNLAAAPSLGSARSRNKCGHASAVWLLDLIHGPEPPTPADEKRELERYWLLPVGR